MELTTLDNQIVELGVADSVIDGLRGRLAGLTADTAAGYELVKAGIAEVRSVRTGVEKARKELKKSALEWGRKVDAEAKRVTELLLKIEEPLRKTKAAVDEEVERRKREQEQEALRKLQAEREAAEVKRLEAEAAERERIQKDREAHEAELQAQREELARERLEIEAERARVDHERRKQEEATRKAREAEEAKQAKIEAEKRAKAEAKRLEREKEAAAKLAAERRPDFEKLLEWAGQIEKLAAKNLGLKTSYCGTIADFVSAALLSAAAKLKTEAKGVDHASS